MRIRSSIHVALRVFGAATVVGTSGAACIPPAVAPEPPDAGPVEPPNFDALKAAVARDLELNAATGAQVAVWIDGQIFDVGAFGTRDPVTGEPTTLDTQFCIGSDTKKLTAILALRQIEAGKLSLDTRTDEILAGVDFPRARAQLAATLGDLLSHQGGGLDWGEGGTSTSDDVLYGTASGAYAREVVTLAPPGQFFNYANPNYALAGLFSEEVARRPYADLIEDEIFQPLGMEHSVARKVELGDDVAGGTGFADADNLEIAPYGAADAWENAFIRPAGLAWSTAHDQMKLAQFLVDGDPAVLDDAARAQLQTPHTPLYPDLPGAYGYGLFLSDRLSVGLVDYEVPVWQHGGNTPIHTSTFVVLPQQRFAISILSNGYGDVFDGALMAAFDSLVDLPEAVAPPASVLPTVDQLQALAGTYIDLTQVGEVQISVVDNHLEMHMPDVEAAGIPYEPVLEAVSPRVYYATIQGNALDLSFIDAPDGNTYLRNRAFVAVRDSAVHTLRVSPASIPPDARTLSKRLREMERVGPPLRHRIDQ